MSNPSDQTNTLTGKVYDDVFHPSAKTAGEILNLIPRSIRVLLQGFEKWIINGEESIRLTAEAIKQKAEAIPEDRLTEPEAYIVVPAIQQLGYSYSSEELRELYANLIVSSMDTEKKGQVHPAFVDILKKLTPDEAKIIQNLKESEIIEYIDLRALNKEGNGSFMPIEGRATLLSDNIKLLIPSNESAYLDNLVSLGILKDNGSLHTDREEIYLRIEEILHLEKLVKELVPSQFSSIRAYRGYYQVTNFGAKFIETVVV